jgi:phosphatidylserine decarboxylase
MEIIYIERETGQKCIEKVYGRRFISLLYGEGFFRGLLSFILLPLFSCVSFFSKLYGYMQKRPRSARKIEPFIRFFKIDADEFAETTFASFNDFFIRKLKPLARPVVQGEKRLVMPADGRHLVFPRFDRFFVKGQEFLLDSFLQDSAWGNRYSEGSMAISRLCPTDYHRFHFPCDGVPSKPKWINGHLYSVNPMALRKRIAILCENKRAVTEFETEHFGTILYVEIGATSVGSIHQTYQPDAPVEKGDEKGYFEFGGSCLVLLFEKGRVQFDADLIQNSQAGFETRSNFGTSLAVALRSGTL